MLIAENLLLLALDDEKGTDRQFGMLESGLAGGLLLDLTLAGALAERDGAIVLTDAEPGRHALLHATRDAIAAADPPRDAEKWVAALPKELKPLRTRVAESLVERGVLRDEKKTFLGLSTGRKYPEDDPRPERELRARMRAVLLDEGDPAPADALLAGMLVPYDLHKGLVEKDEVKAAKARAEQLGSGEAANLAVTKAVNASVQAAVMGALIAATIPTTAMNISS